MQRTHKDKIKQYTPRKLARLFTHHAGWHTNTHREYGATVIRFEKGRTVKVFVVK